MANADESKLLKAAGDDPPIAVAALLRGSGGRQHWVVASCPYCKKRHLHGAGAPGADPRGSLGHRVSHCSGPGSNAGYILTEAAGESALGVLGVGAGLTKE